MRKFLRVAIVGMLVATVSGLVLAVGCGSEDPAVGAQFAASEATGTTIPAEGFPSATTAPGEVTAILDWQEVTVGLPAIQPVLPMQVGIPSITEQAVRDYVADHPPSHVDTTQPVTVKRVEFLPVEDVEEKINHSVGVSRGSLLCLVSIKGTWVLPAKFQVVRTPDPDAVMYLIFDAVTGNYIAKTSGIESD